MSVVNSDSRLQQMVDELDALHLQRNQLARRCNEIREEKDAQRAAIPRYMPRIR